MSLFTDLQKDMAVAAESNELQVFQIFEMLCNLIDLKLDHLEKGLIAQTDYNPLED